MTETTLRVAVAQLNLLVGDIEGNAQRTIDETKRLAAQNNTDLILFPELSLCGYPPEDLLYRPGFISRCQNALAHIKSAVADLSITIIIGYPEKINGKLYNRAGVIQHGKLIAEYSKQVLPNYNVFDEKRYFSCGKASCVFTLKGIKLGLLICEDIWHSEPAIKTAQAGAQMLVTINASPYNREQLKARETALMARANETRIPLIYTNNVGGQDELVFDGGSMVVNAEGERCQQAPYYEEFIMMVTAHLKPDGHVSINHKPLPPRLSEEENIYRTLTLGIRDYVQKNGFKGAIIGLSGGIDSALTLALACDALGSENVTAVMMPSKYTSNMSKEDAKQQATQMGVRYETIPVDTIFDSFLSALNPFFENHSPDKTEENCQARIRGTLLMALSNKFGQLVLATSNKSEMSVGYSTLYGDMVGGFAALKDVYKTMVYKLAHYRNNKSAVIPERVMTRAPSAELAYDQKDQDTLPPYDVLDQILYRYIEKDEAPDTLYNAGFKKSVVDQVVKLVNYNEYKRRQAPIGVRLTQRSFGKDRRYPITSGFLRNNWTK